MTNAFANICLLVKVILENPFGFKWSVQGLGMMRTYVTPEVRIHLWDSSLKVPGVSALHTHPWDLESTVISGIYRQYRYLEVLNSVPSNVYNSVTIKCGENAGAIEEPKKVYLEEKPIEVYLSGDSYKQSKDEIHLSFPDDGTVTLVERKFHADRDHARVFWRGKNGWVDAALREATTIEIEQVVSRSLGTWF